ncbi:MAG: lipid II flippase MurJ, partial [Candidatus Zixiibacteriota bacterium]
MSTENQQLARRAGGVSAATAGSRILGLVREQVFAYLFGAGLATDAFIAAFRIPNLLRDLFAEGAMSAAFVPAFSKKLSREGKQNAFPLFNLVGNALVVVLTLVV